MHAVIEGCRGVLCGWQVQPVALTCQAQLTQHVEKNQISNLFKLLNDISSLLNLKLLNAISSLPKLLNEISSLFNLKILNKILSLPKLLNKISGLLKFLNVVIRLARVFTKNVAYCLPCFLFNKSFERYGNTLQAKGFDHGRSMKDLNVLLLLMWVSIDAVKWLVFQGCAFRGRDEAQDLRNRDIIKFGKLTQRSEVDGIYDTMSSVEFVFILHFIIEMLGTIDDLCQTLQYKSQDILNAMQLVSSTKTLLHKFKDHGWDPLFEKVKLFCKNHEIKVPNLSVSYKIGREMNSRFNDEVVELLVFNSTLDPRDNYKAFRVEDICKLMNDFYLNDFTEQEKLHMKIQLEHFQLDALQSTELQKASTVVELCQVIAKTNKSSIYPFLDRIVRLVLTLLMSTATIERVFSTMKIVKTRLHNRMEDDFLSTYLVGYIKKEIAREFSTDSIIDEFDLMKKWRVQFRMPSIEK
ncbi:hypothetical protein J1N35_044460 [Gossypium stocksii]|uniref:HAT C-terminal dimerisation domain-containing protein n=1 Tax=Gossypium stocksii TaxID=47602 RepID=A0A9D3ZG46_9ROSI|nr:hypothetical protein J1N35_044460 [Gossypium stocksii]